MGLCCFSSLEWLTVPSCWIPNSYYLLFSPFFRFLFSCFSFFSVVRCSYFSYLAFVIHVFVLIFAHTHIYTRARTHISPRFHPKKFTYVFSFSFSFFFFFFSIVLRRAARQHARTQAHTPHTTLRHARRRVKERGCARVSGTRKCTTTPKTCRNKTNDEIAATQRMTEKATGRHTAC